MLVGPVGLSHAAVVRDVLAESVETVQVERLLSDLEAVVGVLVYEALGPLQVLLLN